MAKYSKSDSNFPPPHNINNNNNNLFIKHTPTMSVVTISSPEQFGTLLNSSRIVIADCKFQMTESICSAVSPTIHHHHYPSDPTSNDRTQLT